MEKCWVSTLVGSSFGTAVDGWGAAARLNLPCSVCLDSGGQSLFFIDNEAVRRAYLSCPPAVRSALVQSVTDGLSNASTPMSGIPPLIEMIVSYAAPVDGTF